MASNDSMEMSQDPKMIKDVIESIESEIGNDFSKLGTAKEFYGRLCLARKNLKTKMTKSSEENEVIEKVLDDSREALSELEQMSERYPVLKEALSKLLEKSALIRNTLECKTNEVNELEKLKRYLEWLVILESLSSELEEDLKQEKRQSAVFDFQQLVEISSQLCSTSCAHMKTFLEKLVVHWDNILQERLGSELDKSLQALNWPIVSNETAPSASNPTAEAVSQFEMLFGLLLQLELPFPFISNKKSAMDLNGQLLPLTLMFRHFSKRFLFHFVKSRKTGRLDKPEWYLTQVLTWIRDNARFMDKYVQRLLNESKLTKVSAKVELMRSLVHLAAWKLQNDLPEIVYDDELMTHTVDEVLLFERELQMQGYIDIEPSVIRVLTERVPFTKWLSLELKYSEERMDQIFTSECAWKRRFSVGDDLDDLKVPESAESFMTMLLLMTERYRLLPEAKDQLEFFSLQLKLLDDFRLRLQQLRKAESEEPLKSHFADIVNGVSYVLLVLKEWNNLPFYLQLHASKQTLSKRRISKDSVEGDNITFDGTEKEVVESLFQSIIDLYEHMQNELLATIQHRILNNVKAKSRPYRKEKWFSIVANEIADLTTSAYPMLKILKDDLHRAQEILSVSLFQRVAENLATDLGQYIYEEVILQNLFSEGGAAQLQQDLTRNITPIFASFIKRPESYFKLVKESCILLSLPQGSAKLLKDALQSSHEIGNPLKALEEQNIFKLSTVQALKVMQRRNDMASS